MTRMIGARRILLTVATLLVALGLQAAPADPNPLTYLKGGPTDFVTVRDGTSIAVTVCYPTNYDPEKTYPAILEMAGYENGSQGIVPDGAGPGTQTCTGRTMLGQLRDWYGDNGNYGNPGNPPLSGDSHDGAMGKHFDEDYVVVHASVRGTGCSAGEFDLFSSASARDGKDIIDDWIVEQPWSNGEVGVIGHSYSGITGTMIVQQRPKHLVAASVSGLIDDIYRGITYPGGVFNGLFPPLWTLGIRPAYDVLGGSMQGVLRTLHDRPEIAAQCAANMATHRRTVVDDPVLHGLSETDTEWFRARSLITNVDDIQVPFHVVGAFQDEQTGPRFQHLWERVGPGVPKRMLQTNGNHGTDVDPPLVSKDRRAWMDHWMGVAGDGYYDDIGFDPAQTPVSVRTLFELRYNDTTSEIKDSVSFPLEDTTWTPLYVTDLDQETASGTLSTGKPAASGSASYVSGTKRQSWSYQAGPGAGPPLTTRHGPDELELRYAIPADGSPLAIAGPITANLFLSTSGTDTDLFVQVIDERPDGRMWVLQRGLLRASHAGGIDADLSDYFGNDPDALPDTVPFMYRPWRSHTNPQPVTPLEVREYLVEVFPVAHIFRPGHTIVIKLMAPPAVDSYYSYTPGAPPASVNTLHFSPNERSRVTLPVVGLPTGYSTTGVGCGDYHSVRCVPQ